MTRTIGWALALVTWLMLPAAALTGATAAETARELKWADLVPPAPPKPPRSPLAGRSMFNIGGDGPNKGIGGDEPPPPPAAEGRWMSGPVKRRSSGPPAVVSALDGQRVRIGGYVVPLDFDATTVKEFLLVPFVGACIHVPPPPPNQIVYVTSEKGFAVNGVFDPVYVTGKMSTSGQFTGLAETGYTLMADEVTTRQE